ncbi:UNVERIFIED_CONTAM: hypothetical protein DES50_10767 [Williamsia faeni]
MTSPDDQLDGIFSQIAAQDQVDPAVFDQTLETAFDYDGAGFDELIPETDTTFSDDTDTTDDDIFVGDLTDELGGDYHDDADDADTQPDSPDHTDHSDYIDHTDHSAGDDLFS